MLSSDHFSVAGTLVKAWASMKSFQPKGSAAPEKGDDLGNPPDTSDPAAEPTVDQPTTAEPEPMTRPTHRNRNAEVDFRGERRSSATHASTTDPEARLFKKSPGTGSMLCFMGHSLMETRSSLIVQADLGALLTGSQTQFKTMEYLIASPTEASQWNHGKRQALLQRRNRI